MLAEKIYEFIAVSPLLLKYETGLLTQAVTLLTPFVKRPVIAVISTNSGAFL